MILFYLILVFIIFLNCNCLNIDPIYKLFSSVNYYNNKLLIMLVVFVVFFIYLVLNLKSKKSNNYLSKSMLLFLFLSTLIFVFQLINGELFSEIFGDYYFFLIILLLFPLNKYINDDKSYNVFLRIVLIIGFMYMVINCYYYLFDVNPNSTLVTIRDGQKRMTQTGDFVCFIFVLSLINTLNDDKKMNIFCRIIVILSFVFLVLISRVRMYIVCSILVGLVFLLVNLKVHKNVKIFISLVGIISIILILIIGQSSVVNLLFGDGEKFDSAIYRFEEIEHYSKYFFENILYGFGFTNNEEIMLYTVTDIGVFAFVFRYGIMGVIWLVYFIYSLFKTYYLMRLNKIGKSKYLSLIVYMCITSISLIFFDPQRILYLPLTIFLLNYCGHFSEVKK